MDIFAKVIGQFMAFALILVVAFVGRLLFEFLRDEGSARERLIRCKKWLKKQVTPDEDVVVEKNKDTTTTPKKDYSLILFLIAITIILYVSIRLNCV